MRSKFSAWLPNVGLIALLAALALLFHWRLIAPNPADRATFPPGDFVHQFYGFTRFEAQEWWAGRLPLWNPYAYGGHPFLADPQSAIFYPLSLLTVWLALFTTGGSFPFIALEWEVIAHIFLASAFTYAYVRHLTGSRPAGLIAGLTFAYSGYLTGYPPLQLAILETDIWLPLILLLLHKALTPSLGPPSSVLRPLSLALGAGLALGVAILAGHPQSAMYVAYMAVLYFAFLAWPQRRAWRRLLVLLGVFLLAAFGLAAVQWLPSLEYMRLSIRASASYEWIARGFPFRDGVQMLVPGQLSLWSPLYVGILPLLCVGVALALRPTRIVIFWAAVALVALLLSFGRHTFVYGLFYLFVPGFQLFQSQERAAFIVSFALAVLAGYGVAALWDKHEAWAEDLLSRIRRGIGLATAAALAALFALALAWVNDGRTNDAPLAGLLDTATRLVLFLAAAYALLSACQVLTERAGSMFAVSLLVIDLFTVNADTNLVITPLAELGPPGPLVAQAQADPDIFRTYNEALHPSYGILTGIEDTWGVSPIRLRRYDDFTQIVPLPRRWELLNVKYVFTWDTAIPHTTTVGQEGEIGSAMYLQQVNDPGARAWLVYHTETIPDDAAALARLSDPALDVRRVAIVAEPVSLDEAGQERSSHRVEITGKRAGWLSLDVETEREGLLVISEQAYPGWRAWLDGREVPLVRADVILQALVVPAGRHHVEVRFDPLSVKVGLAMTLLTLLVSGGWLLWRLRRPKS
jgi:hypothetical protein